MTLRARFFSKLLFGGASLALGSWASAEAQQSPPTSSDLKQDVERLRQELEAMKRDYADRIAALEGRLAALKLVTPTAPGPAPEAPMTSPSPQPQAQAAVPAGAEGGGPSGFLPVYGGGGAGASKVFNPDISAIGDFIGVAGKSPGGGEPSLALHEAEVGLQAVVDPYARADFFLTWSPDSVNVEEGYITFPTLPGGFLVKVGRLRDVFGKVDGMHNHVLPFVDRPLVTNSLTGGEDGLADGGITVSRLIPIPGLFLEATGQIYRGQSTIFQAPTRGDLAYVGHLRFYQDLSESSNVDLGGSFAYGHNGVAPDSTTRLFGADASFRYKPLRRAIYTHLLARAELVWSRRQDLPAYQRAFGAYGYLEYQFARRWFAGARYDVSDRAQNASLRDKGGSFIITYWPSEFSQVRGQYRYTDFAEGRAANEFLFQALFSIGAHGAHPF